MVLRPGAGDLDGADPVGKLHAALQRPAVGQTMEQRPAEGVAATGGVDDRSGLLTSDMLFLALRPDVAAIGAQGFDEAFEVRQLGQLGEAQAGAFAQHLAFVVVHGNPGGLLDEAAQLGAVKHGQALAGVEDERDLGGSELLGVLDHRVAAIRRDDG